MPASSQEAGSGPDESQGIQSLEIGISIFRLLHEAGRALRLGEVAEAAGMSPGKAHRYLVSLVRTGLIQRDGRGLYALGPLAMQLGQSQAWYAGALEIAGAALPGIAAKLGQTAFLAAWGQKGPRILRVEEAPGPVSLRPRTSGDLPLYNSSPGRLFAAYMPDRTDRLLDREFAALAAEHRWSSAELQRRRDAYRLLLDEVRQHGLASTASERFPGINSLAAPVFDVQAKVLFTVTVFGIDANFPLDLDGPAAALLKDTVGQVTRRVGGKCPRTLLQGEPRGFAEES